MATARARRAVMITRRRVMVTGAVVAAGAAGAVLGTVRPVHVARTKLAPPPAALTSALAREQAMLAALDAALRADPSLRPRIAQIRNDHAAHAVALESAIGAYPAYPTTAAASSGPSGTVAVQSATELRSAEQSAATLAAAASAALGGADAALLASISAAESTHAALLT
jgi:hypothetical protein